MHHANIYSASPRRPATLDTVYSSDTRRQTRPCDLEPTSAASRACTAFTFPAWENSSAEQANDQTAMDGSGASPSERQFLEAVGADGRVDHESSQEREYREQSALGCPSSLNYTSCSDASLHHGQQPGLYRLEEARLHDASTEVAEQEAAATYMQICESQDQIKRRDVLLGLWNEMSCDFAAKARLLRFDSRLPESNRAPLAVALDQMEAYHVQVVKYCMMHVDGFLDYGFNCFLSGEQRHKDNADSSGKPNDHSRTLGANQVWTRIQPLAIGIDACAHHLVKDSPEAGHEAYSGDEQRGHTIFENSPDGASNYRKGEESSRSGTGGQTMTDLRESSIALATEDSSTILTSAAMRFSAVSHDGFSTSGKVSTTSDHSPEEARNSQRAADKGKSVYTAPDHASAHSTTNSMRMKRLKAVILSLDRACSQLGEMADLMEDINRKLRSNYHVLPVGVRHRFSQVLTQKSAKLSNIGYQFCHRMACETTRIELVLASAAVPPEVQGIDGTEADSGCRDYQRGSCMRPLQPKMHAALLMSPEAGDKREDRGLGRLLRVLPALNCLVTTGPNCMVDHTGEFGY
ncbi:uncharacterized protein PpBr36_06231 [Pyricularia pennisetigena]|uniref:uncharacterized protein n=1 Tax=Pyricularia pennisetigena TaxID=1578925 RepID=UPI0011535A35|nr:uncharacterized protein PpBr36_06231 [Pyricularia pennisetigena]TLS22918.1 hypothetical protein PpBr36_06231 [Pyricularia pennisetigena]